MIETLRQSLSPAAKASIVSILTGALLVTAGSTFARSSMYGPMLRVVEQTVLLILFAMASFWRGIHCQLVGRPDAASDSVANIRERLQERVGLRGGHCLRAGCHSARLASSRRQHWRDGARRRLVRDCLVRDGCDRTDCGPTDRHAVAGRDPWTLLAVEGGCVSCHRSSLFC